MKNGHYIRRALAVIGIMLLIVSGIAVKIFIIGEPVDGAQMYYDISVDGQSLELRAGTAASAAAFRGWKFRQDGNRLYISARKVLVSSLFHDGGYRTTIDLNGLEEIYLGGRKIWPEDGTFGEKLYD